jgi:arylsulfatase A-like enzyme
MKWIVAMAVALVAAVVLVRMNLPTLIMRYPALIGVISRLSNPIGDNVPVEWDAGPDVAAVPAAERPPNIVVILVDDLGWNDLTWNGGGIANGTVPTPNIDSIAARGVQFTNGYAGNATCAPSRAALMTGRYGSRFGFESTPAPAAMGAMVTRMTNERRAEGQPPALFHADLVDQVPPLAEQGMPSSEITIAELLEQRDYHSVALGKWHLGETDGQRPTDQGFDEFLGFYSGGQLYLPEDDPDVVNSKQTFDPIDMFLWSVLPFAVRKDTGPRFTPDAYMTDYLSREATRAIEANKHRPFFMYLAYNAPHTPLQATRADYDALSHIDDHATRVYAAMLRALDRGVGQVLDALRELGLEDNTLVMFSSDNGGAHYVGLPDLNEPYRGWKMTFFEGGLHSPFFLKWPAQLPAGGRVDSAVSVSHIDMFATAAAAAGVPVPTDRKIDGVDLLLAASGQGSIDRFRTLYWRSGGLRVALSQGWKLQHDPRRDKLWLYDLNTDPTERNNLFEQEPSRGIELFKRLEAHDKDLGPPAFPAIVEGAIPIDRTLAEPHVPGEEFAYWPN